MKNKKENQKEIILLIKEIERIDNYLAHPQISKDFKDAILKIKEEHEIKIQELQTRHLKEEK